MADAMIELMGAEEILSTHTIFKSADESLYRKLAKKWHPDQCSHPKADAVFARVTEHYMLAKKGVFPNTLTIRTSKGELIVPYRAEVSSSSGPLFISDRYMVWRVPRAYDPLIRHMMSLKKSWRFPTKAMENEFKPYVPSTAYASASGDTTHLVVETTPGMIRLADIVRVKGPLGAEHVAWIISSMLNIASWLEWSGQRHQDISLESFFIQPEEHMGSLLGGWFFAGSGDRDLRPKSISARTVKLVPTHATKSDASLHMAMIRSCARKLLGLSNPHELRKSTIPEPLKNWLQSGDSSTVIGEYGRWKTVLSESFGQRKFVKFPWTARDIYG